MSITAIIRAGLLSAAGVIAYTTAIGSFMFNAHGAFTGPDTVLAPISMLTLLVLSVGVVGSLIFVRPVLIYLDGKRVEAVKLLIATLSWLGVFTAVLLLFQLIA